MNPIRTARICIAIFLILLTAFVGYLQAEEDKEKPSTSSTATTVEYKCVKYSKEIWKPLQTLLPADRPSQNQDYVEAYISLFNQFGLFGWIFSRKINDDLLFYRFKPLDSKTTNYRIEYAAKNNAYLDGTIKARFYMESLDNFLTDDQKKKLLTKLTIERFQEIGSENWIVHGSDKPSYLSGYGASVLLYKIHPHPTISNDNNQTTIHPPHKVEYRLVDCYKEIMRPAEMTLTPEAKARGDLKARARAYSSQFSKLGKDGWIFNKWIDTGKSKNIMLFHRFIPYNAKKPNYSTEYSAKNSAFLKGIIETQFWKECKNSFLSKDQKKALLQKCTIERYQTVGANGWIILPGEQFDFLQNIDAPSLLYKYLLTTTKKDEEKE